MKPYQGYRSQAGLCAAILAIALLVRLATGTQALSLVQDAAQNPDVAAALLRAGLGGTTAAAEPAGAPASDEPLDVSAAPEQEAAPAAAEPDASQTAAAEEDEPEPLVFTQADADAIIIAGTSSYEKDAAALLAQAPALDFSQEGPRVLIIHTHASEAYTPVPGWEYEPSDTLRTEDAAHNVVRVGTALSEALEALGVGVVHDTTIRDYPSYDGSYTRTLTAIEAHLAEHPSIRIVIDLHRDAAEEADGSPVAVRCTVDGQDAAQLMFVVGTDEGGLPHPNWEENLRLAVRLQALLNRAAPGLCRPIDLRTERFNQHAAFGSMLIEVGASGNTLPEALASVGPLAEALAAVIADVA